MRHPKIVTEKMWNMSLIYAGKVSSINIGMVHPNFALCVIVICKHYFVVFHKSKALSTGINMMSAQSVAIYCVEIEIGPILAVS